jgi:hypothetical protein
MDEAGFPHQRTKMPLAATLAGPQAPSASPATESKEAQTSAQTVFTMPEGQEFRWGVEITEAIEGVTDGDSYLFSTIDGDKYRAFIVPKNDPGKQYEIPDADGRLDTKRHEFHLNLGQGHSLYLKSDGVKVFGKLDGHNVRVIDDFGEEYSLIKEKHFFGASVGWSAEEEAVGTQTASYAMGDSWTFMQKDFKPA